MYQVKKVTRSLLLIVSKHYITSSKYYPPHTLNYVTYMYTHKHVYNTNGVHVHVLSDMVYIK